MRDLHPLNMFPHVESSSANVGKKNQAVPETQKIDLNIKKTFLLSLNFLDTAMQRTTNIIFEDLRGNFSGVSVAVGFRHTFRE